MSLSIAIVGLPNVGKSTLFNALLKRQVALAANYPFATIEPNVGMAEVPDNRLEKLAEVAGTKVIKPAVVEFVDIAGLIKGASKGEGLGNKFLANIRECQAICHVLRDFEDKNVLREGSVDPKNDLEIIRTELQLADLETLNKQHEPKGSVSREEKEKWNIIQRFKERIENGVGIFGAGGVGTAYYAVRTEDRVDSLKNYAVRTEDRVDSLKNNAVRMESQADSLESQVAKDLCLLSAKPEIFAVNVDEGNVGTAYYAVRTEFAKAIGVDLNQVVVISAKIESELSSLSSEDQKLYLKDLGLEKSGLERLAEVAYKTLNLQSFLTAGEKEVRAWTIKQGTLAPEAAGVIHSDFEKKFIKANVCNYQDFIDLRGFVKAKEQGKVRQEGKDYMVKDDDVVEFMIGS
jgi:ribosome-binding ATPase